ncbi:MAG: serine/threonine protein kinase [Fuerstia sp.]|nr:serine/threonine protein kinase [Fuerstiella sp.]
MTQLSANEAAEPLTATAHVPLSERPLVADDENTVISSPEQPRAEMKPESAAATAANDAIRNRLFPSNGVFKGEEIGIRLAHFQITGRLGSGGMGAVFRATDLELARDVALKILHPSSSQDASLIARFRNEARACGQLNHDNIARVYYAGSQDGLYFIAYEFASGRTIRDLIVESGRLSPADTINYAIQVTLALNHTAAAGIVHRDIKPSNIMLTTSGRVKVVDLGLARRDTTDSIGDITVAGTTLGTFDYIAPEQARDPRNADGRSDIYSLGCTMYHMLTGRPPYPEGTALQKLLDHQGKSPPDPRTLNSSVPEEIAAIMRKMMANNPDDRYQAPGLLLNDLIQMAQILGLQSVPAEGIVWRKLGPAGNRQPLGAVWVFVSVLLICLTAVFLHRVPPSSRNAESVANGQVDIGYEVDQIRIPEINGATALSGTPTVPVSSNETDVPKPVDGKAVSELPNTAATPSSPILTPTLTLEQLQTQLVYPFLPPLARMGTSRPQNPEIVPGAASLATAGPFVLQRSTGAAESFRTLKAAVADARSGDVVLLRYNGYPDDLLTQPPVRIVGMDIIIRAEEGFRPTLVFDGAPEGTVSPGQMISLRGNGKLTLRDVDLRVVARDDLTADRWSLFHCTGPNKIDLSNVSIDCRNSDGQPVALFDLVGDPAAPEAVAVGKTEISLTRVICRAESDGIRIASQVRGRIELQDCGIALNGSLIDNRGDSSMPAARGAVDVVLNHVTCLTAAPMLKIDDTDSNQPGGMQRLIPRISVESEGSVFAAQGTDRRLMLTEGSSIVDDLESLVSWNGFNNLYDGFGIYWQIETSAQEYASRRQDFAQWIRYWGDRTDSEETNAELLPELAWQNGSWKVSGSESWLRELTPSSFELNAAIFLPGVKSLQLARDGFVPGVNAAELPRFPQQPAAPVIDPALSPTGNTTAATDRTTTGAAASVGSPAAGSATPTVGPGTLPPPTGESLVPTGE